MLHNKKRLWPTQPSVQWVPGKFSLGVMYLVRKGDHSPKSSSVVMCGAALRPHPLHLHGVVLKYRNQHLSPNLYFFYLNYLIHI
jgi:hypothetical protein